MKLLMISGSLRTGSYNTAIVDFLAKHYENSGRIEPIVFRELANIPPFTPDLDIHESDSDNSPEKIQEMRSTIKSSDAVLISTPEYAFEIPGVLKNALDWIVSSGEFVEKPTMVISSSTSSMGGKSAYKVLTKLLDVLSAKVVEDEPLIIDSVNKKIDESGRIVDIGLAGKLVNGVEYLYKEIEDGAWR